MQLDSFGFFFKRFGLGLFGAHLGTQEPKRCHGADDAATEPDPIGMGGFHYITCGERANGAGKAVADVEECHIASAHVHWCKFGYHSLVERGADHFTDGDDDKSQDKPEVGVAKTDHAESDSIEHGSDEHHERLFEFCGDLADAELEEHHHAGVDGQQIAELFGGDAVQAVQVDREGGVVVHVDHHGQHDQEDEGDEYTVFEYCAVSGEGIFQALFAAGGSGFIGARLGHLEQQDDAGGDAQDAVDDEEQQEGAAGEQPAQQRTNGNGEVGDNTHGSVTLGSFFGWQKIGQQRLEGGACEMTHECGQQIEDDEHFPVVGQPQGDGDEGTAEETDQTDGLASIFIRHSAPDAGPYHVDHGAYDVDPADVDERYVEFLCDVERQEWEEQRATDIVDK